MKGSYSLLIKVPEDTIEVGALGSRSFENGFVVYNGSAFGPGGLKRVQRHKDKSEDGGDPHWHIDYLLVREDVEIMEVFRAESDHECGLSGEMMERFEGIDDFGCSDCECGSHLFFSEERDRIQDFLGNFYPNQEF